MLIIQILSDGAVSANWVMAAVMSVCAILLLRMLNRMEKRADSHGDALKNHGEKLANHSTRLDGHDDDIDRHDRKLDNI